MVILILNFNTWYFNNFNGIIEKPILYFMELYIQLWGRVEQIPLRSRGKNWFA